MGSRPFMTLFDLGPMRVQFSTTKKQNSPVTFTTNNLCRTATKCVQLLVHYTRIDTGDIKTFAHKGDMTFSQ